MPSNEPHNTHLDKILHFLQRLGWRRRLLAQVRRDTNSSHRLCNLPTTSLNYDLIARNRDEHLVSDDSQSITSDGATHSLLPVLQLSHPMRSGKVAPHITTDFAFAQHTRSSHSPANRGLRGVRLVSVLSMNRTKIFHDDKNMNRCYLSRGTCVHVEYGKHMAHFPQHGEPSQII